MRTPLLIAFLLCFSLELYAQEGGNRRTPLFVTHLSSENKALLRRKASPKHNVINRVICFKAKCRAFIGWRTKQRSTRFKGYKKGGALPPSRVKPPDAKDTTVVINMTPPSEKNPAANTAVATTQLFVLDELLFENNSAQLNEALTYRLDSLADLVVRNASVSVLITGHTDNTGSAEHNLKLSTARARSVAGYLIGNGVDEQRISYRGMGSQSPAVTNDTEQGRARNRRVEVLLSSRD
jgi:outer membrane protein OmpA-like peptidoglycan-associated protein